MEKTIDYGLRIASAFRLRGEPVSITANERGLINTTSVVEAAEGEKYILQKINTGIFRHPDEVMENIVAVTEHLKKKIRARGGDETRETLTVIPTKTGESLYIDEDGGAYRMYLYIRDAECYDSADSPELFFKVGKAFGHFQRELSDFDASVLHEAIPHFHDTKKRFDAFVEAVNQDAAGRKSLCEEEIRFILDREDKAAYVVDRLRDGRLPLRVTHNDTKLNNIMMDKESGEGLAVIDLDTVMPGSMLYEYGDAIRFGASSAPEDETDLSRIYLRMDMFEAFTGGFLEGLGGAATEEEILALPMGAYMLTLEQAMRFLTDYLNGDTYFKVRDERHNLERTRAQIALLKDIERRADDMNAVVRKYL